ncbi:aldehyde dehydrogenase family 3 member H1-like isoform X1 [Rosa rugosa]|uniref:aldehyde dehydrogenase family 3 member H1-like isoform X1 n=1 Tax=Rosa rugosa TaxID=74645 RepID=UPI002B40671E|nr:aldehyde dehydrogenase family 3 member H1-like isoform X1 [Rosa rugosa]
MGFVLPTHLKTDLSSRLVGTGSARAFSYRFQRKNHQAFLSFPKLVVSSASFSQKCFATVAPVVAEVEEKKTFDSETAGLLVKELRKSFNSGRTKSYEWRMLQLSNIARMLDEKEKDIIEALYKDLSKPELEAFISEISTAKSSCKEALEGLKQWMVPQKVKTSISTYPSSAEIVSEPLGVVLVISTWNFPFLLSIDPIIGAISAGNAVVLKPSEIAPATSSLLVQLVEEYLDSSAVKVVEGAIPETTALLEQRWDKILYTGSAKVGRIVMAAAAKHLTPVILELGGKSPAVVDSNVDLQVAVRRIIAGKWACNNGQACIGVDYIITTKDFAPKLIEALKNELEQFFGKDPMNSKDISRIVSSTQFARLVKLLEEDKVSDKIVLGGQTDENQLKIAPTILLDIPEDTQIMNEEIFGPLLPIVTVEKIEGSFDVINSRPKPLAVYVFTNNEQLKKSFVENISSGGMLINDTVLHVAVAGLPFGGVGESGMGSYHGKFSFDGFSHKKSVLYRSFSGDSTLRYPPYTPEKQKLLKAVISGNIFSIIMALIGW